MFSFHRFCCPSTDKLIVSNEFEVYLFDYLFMTFLLISVQLLILLRAYSGRQPVVCAAAP